MGLQNGLDQLHAELPPRLDPLKFGLKQVVRIGASRETGTIIASAFYAFQENGYLLRYKANDGRAVEQWWGESALEAA